MSLKEICKELNIKYSDSIELINLEALRINLFQINYLNKIGIIDFQIDLDNNKIGIRLTEKGFYILDRMFKDGLFTE